MINATGKRYKCLGNNIYEENVHGACIGAEWTDASGNTLRMLWALTPSFNPSAMYAEMTYMLFIKPVGRENFLLEKELNDQIGVDKYFYGNFPSLNFGKREPEPYNEEGVLKEGLVTQVQFFIDNIVVNEHGLPMSFKSFIYQFIESTQNVTIV